jgi:hypothetical protein
MHSIRQINPAVGNFEHAERDRDRSHWCVHCDGVALSYLLAVDHSKARVAERDCAHAQAVGTYLHDYWRRRGSRMRRRGNAMSCGVHQLANRGRLTVDTVVPAEDPAGYRDKKNAGEYPRKYCTAIATKDSHSLQHETRTWFVTWLSTLPDLRDYRTEQSRCRHSIRDQVHISESSIAYSMQSEPGTGALRFDPLFQRDKRPAPSRPDRGTRIRLCSWQAVRYPIRNW